eukprot:8082715-Lingulodinium_polyedra.AAC.1
MRRARQAVRGPGDVLFDSSPCTGGLPWQRVNAARCAAHGRSEYDAKQRARRISHQQFWAHF